MLFDDPGDAARDAAALGLADRACVEREFGGALPAPDGAGRPE